MKRFKSILIAVAAAALCAGVSADAWGYPGVKVYKLASGKLTNTGTEPQASGTWELDATYSSGSPTSYQGWSYWLDVSCSHLTPGATYAVEVLGRVGSLVASSNGAASTQIFLFSSPYEVGVAVTAIEVDDASGVCVLDYGL